MAKVLRLQVVCWVSPRWKKRVGKKWGSCVRNTVKSTAKLLSILLDISIEFKIVSIENWDDIRNADLKEFNSFWYKNKNIKNVYTRVCPKTYHRALRELYLLSVATTTLESRVSCDENFTNYYHIGFVELYRTRGGGKTAGENLPIVVVHGAQSGSDLTATLAHELLHTFGAEHSRKGTMRPEYPINTSFLDEKNKKLIRKKILRHLSRL